MGREMGGRFKREGIYVHLWLIHVEVWQKTTQFCKAVILQKKKLKKGGMLAQLCLTLFYPWSSLGSSACGILQARILEWVAISYCRGSSQPRNRTCLSCIGRQILYHWATWDTNSLLKVTEPLPTPFIKRIFFFNWSRLVDYFFSTCT